MAKKNPAAVALGKLGGKIGGKMRMKSMSAAERKEFASKGGKIGGRARAEKLSSRRLSEIGRQAAQARWANAKRSK